jgi:peptidoglycan hydrolase CwlO-like protein
MKNPFKENQPPGDPMEQDHQRLVTIAARLGKSTGERNAPVEGEDLASYFGQLTAGYQSMVATNVTRLIATTSSSISDFQQTSMKDKVKRLNANLTDFNEKLRKAMMQRDELPQNIDHSKHIGVRVFIVVIALFESFFTAKAFAVFSHGSNLAQLFVLGGLTVVFVLLPSAIVWVIRNTEDKPNKWLFRGLAFLIVIAAFITLGILRSIFLQNIGSTTLSAVKANGSVELKPWYFAILNIFFTFISTYACLQIPDNTQRRNAENETKLNEKIADLENRIRQTEDQITRLPDTLVNSENTRQQNIAVAQEKAGQINSLYYQACSEYIEANLKWRSDGIHPFDFSKIPALKMPNF